MAYRIVALERATGLVIAGLACRPKAHVDVSEWTLTRYARRLFVKAGALTLEQAACAKFVLVGEA